MASLNLCSPWVMYYHEIEAFFKKDPEVRVIYDDEKHEISLYVESSTKAEALTKLLPAEQEFGNIILKINVIPANTDKAKAVRSSKSLIENALKGHPDVEKIRTFIGVYNNPLTYVVFNKKVVQYYTDDLGDYNGFRSTLYQDIAKEIFDGSQLQGVFFCTSKDEPNVSINTPLGEWP